MVKMYEQNNKTYAKILATGKIHMACTPEDEGAQKREVELSDKTIKTYWEKRYNALEGTITDIEIQEGDYGTQLYITLDSEITITTGTGSNFGSSLMSILPNVDLKQPVKIAPYAFESEGRSIKGVNIYQNDKKVANYFKKSVKGKKPELLHDFPEVDEKKKPDASSAKKWSRFWRDYFEEVEEFLIENTQKLVFTTEKKEPEPKEEKDIDLESVPFN